MCGTGGRLIGRATMRRLSAGRGVLLLGKLVALSVFGSRELFVLSMIAINTPATHSAREEGCLLTTRCLKPFIME